MILDQMRTSSGCYGKMAIITLRIDGDRVVTLIRNDREYILSMEDKNSVVNYYRLVIILKRHDVIYVNKDKSRISMGVSSRRRGWHGDGDGLNFTESFTYTDSIRGRGLNNICHSKRIYKTGKIIRSKLVK